MTEKKQQHPKRKRKYRRPPELRSVTGRSPREDTVETTDDRFGMTPEEERLFAELSGKKRNAFHL